MREQIKALRKRWAHSQLARRKAEQRATFAALRHDFAATYRQLKTYDISPFVNPAWESNNSELEQLFSPAPPFGFLNVPTIKATMFVEAGGKWLADQLSFLEQKLEPNRLKALLMEDLVGDPPLINATYLTSHNSIHHLYHLIKFATTTRCDLENLKMVVEWGGGYGNMAKIFRRLQASPSTYVIIDTPLFSTLQWLYLTTILGSAHVNLLRSPQDAIRDGKINLLPLSHLDRHPLRAELFISTWALSESSKYSQDYVRDRQWFGAKHLLIAYQDSSESFPDADRIGKIAAGAGAVVDDIEFLPQNHYAFR